MSTHNAGGSGSQAVGVGPGNDGRGHSQQGSGGSGAGQLKGNLGSAAPSIPAPLIDEATPVAPEGAGSAATATTRGAQDTRAHQAGSTGTGLGAPETGANQQASDLPPPRK